MSTLQKFWLSILLACALNANPIATEIINEFQVAPSDSERIELHFLTDPRSSLMDVPISLINTQVITIDTAVVDTNIVLPPYGYATIERKILDGWFRLRDDNGYMRIRGPFMPVDEEKNYPLDFPTPPIYSSTAKFYFYYFDYDMGGEWLVRDWYIDSTPTFGFANDDYPGCLVAGYVFDNNGLPLVNAQVKASAIVEDVCLYAPPQYYQTRITTTSADGAYDLTAFYLGLTG